LQDAGNLEVYLGVFFHQCNVRSLKQSEVQGMIKVIELDYYTGCPNKLIISN